MSLRMPLHLSRQSKRQFSSSLQQLYRVSAKAPSFPTVPTCPPSTCECAATPPMPDGLEIHHKGNLNGVMSNYREQVLICTGKEDWPSRIEEDNSGDNLAADLKELFGRGGVYSDPFLKISVLNSSFPSSVPARTELVSTSAYLLPSFKYVPFLPRVSFDSVEALAKGFLLPEKLSPMHDGLSPIHQDRLTRKPVYGQLLHGVKDVEDIMVLICSHGGRDMRCGVIGPVLGEEFEAQLPRQGVEVVRGPVKISFESDVQAVAGTIEKPALTARVGLISHIGGHKFAGNVIIYLPPTMKAEDGEGIEPPKRRRAGGRKLVVGAITSLTAGLLYALIPDNNPNRSQSSSSLNNETFRKFTVVSNEPISPTSFILTVKPSLASGDGENSGVIRKAWEHGLWSVEIKQPQLQIARHYTPLPPSPPISPQDNSNGNGEAAPTTTLRFLIRRYEGGEVSKYLSRLRGPASGALGAGDIVELRGPHLGFDVAARMGGGGGGGGGGSAAGGRDVVFLAGGTGIAPALQAARRVLLLSAPPGREEAGRPLTVRIYWANRSALDCVGCSRPEAAWKGRSWSSVWSASDGGSDGLGEAGLGVPGPIVQQLRDLESAYRQRGHTLEFKCVVDEEGSRIGARDITAAVGRPPLPSISTPSPRARRGDDGHKVTSDQASLLSSCQLHSQRLLQNSTEDVDAQEEKKAQISGRRRCNCDGDGATGKNLFMISGPDGFVSAYVGPKVWAAGAERQGPLGGVVGELRKKDPKLWRDWLVLKQ